MSAHAVPSPIQGAGAVTSVHGRAGTVIAAASDYDASQVDNDSTVVGTTVKDALETLDAKVGGVSTVFGRAGAVVAAASDYDASQVDNDSTVVGATVAAALDTLAAGSSVVLAQGEIARGGPSGLYKTIHEWVSVLDYVADANRAAMQAGTFDCRGPFQDAFDTGRDVFVPQGIYRIMSNNNAYATGHPVLADMVTAGFEVGLIDADPYRRIIGEGSAASAATGGISEFSGSRNFGVQLVSSLPLAAMVYVDDLTPSDGAADQRGGSIERIGFKDWSTNQNQIFSGIMVGSRWHYRIRECSFARIARETGTVIPIGSTGSPAMPVMEDLVGAAIMSTSHSAGAETVQYLHIENNIFERCTNGIFFEHDCPDFKVINNMFYGAQKDIGGDSPNAYHNQGTGCFINCLDGELRGNNWQHTGRGVHIWGRNSKSRAIHINRDTFENPVSHGWSAAQRGIVYGLIVDGSNIASVIANDIVFANGASYGAPLYVDSSVPNGGFILNDVAFLGTSPTGAVTNNPNDYWLVDSGRRTVGFYSETLTTPGLPRPYRLNEAGDVVRSEITGTTEAWTNAWTQGT